MTRIAILDRADMNAEQARVYDAAKASSGIVGGPYHAYIRLPKLFEACQDLRASLSSGPLSRREQQIVNLVVARHWSARYPWFAQVRASLAVGIERPVIDAINARKTPDLADARERTCFVVARELLANKGLSDQTYAAAEKTMGLEGLVALVASTGSFSMTCMTANTFGIDPPPETRPRSRSSAAASMRWGRDSLPTAPRSSLRLGRATAALSVRPCRKRGHAIGRHD